ncbi:MAG TPA: helix-turn-helix domain-containing protein [Oligoflexia bacterium]|nr:helix-turn-helix domain-containing protein [Oligoflexia bacterium]
MSKTELLLRAGLSEKESAVYLAMLKYGSRPTSFIAEKTELNRGTAYVTLHALLAKGLVSKSIRRKVQYFSPLDPEQLVYYVEHQRSELAQTSRRLTDTLSELRQQMNPLASKPKIQFFEGRDGARAVFDCTLQAKEKTLRAFLSLGDIADLIGPEYLEDYTNRRIKRGYTLLVLRTMEKDKLAMTSNTYARKYITSKVQHRQVRYLSADLAFPLSMYLFDNKTAIVSSREENYGMIIESGELCEMQKKLFLLLWEQADRRKPQIA